MNILSLQASNVLRLSAISIKADGKNVTLTGKNGSGKTSVMRCIEIALGGKGMMAEKTIKEGESEGLIELDLGDIKATCRLYIAKNGTEERTIKLTSKEGASYPSPQAMLDKLVGQLTFDPLAFSRLKPIEQSETLRKLVGLDFTQLDKERKETFDKRTVVNRDVDQKKSLLATMPVYAGAPAGEQSVQALANELGQAALHNSNLENLKTVAAQADRAFNEAVANKDLAAKQVEKLKADLAAAEGYFAICQSKAVALDTKADEAQASVDAFKPIKTDAIKQQICDIDVTNRKVTANKSVRVVKTALETVIAEANELTARLAELDKEKHDLLEATKFPVVGLSFTESGVLYRDLPFEQASAGEQLRVSAAIGMALNPKLKILMIRDASLLDDEAMALLADQAADKGYQLWLERVGTGKEVSVVIEEGVAK